MTGPISAYLPGGRLHLQHGPIDLVIGADGDGRKRAFRAAEDRFQTVLSELVEELSLLRQPLSRCPSGQVAQRMFAACRFVTAGEFVTPMAAVAGAVADEVLIAMRRVGGLDRAYVNNGGDIAIHLDGRAHFSVGMLGVHGNDMGRITVPEHSPVRGIATSGAGGRSLSLGIADSVTVLAENAACADVAATLIANAVTLPDHPAITRRPACSVQEDSDLGTRLVTAHVGPLDAADIRTALEAGGRKARAMLNRGVIIAAALSLQGATRCIGWDDTKTSGLLMGRKDRELENA